MGRTSLTLPQVRFTEAMLSATNANSTPMLTKVVTKRRAFKARGAWQTSGGTFRKSRPLTYMLIIRICFFFFIVRPGHKFRQNVIMQWLRAPIY